MPAFGYVDKAFTRNSDKVVSNSPRMSEAKETPDSRSKKWIYQSLIVLAFVIITSSLFVYLNNVQQHTYIDEEFHVGQTLRYCEGRFLEWDKKITTLPGLYLITILFLVPLRICAITYMRCLNLVGTFLNLYLVYKLVEITNWSGRKKTSKHSWTLLGFAFAVTLLPPLFFWFFLYYTDVASVNWVLLSSLMHLKGRYRLAASAGALAILVRQTNVIWVAVLAAERIVDLLEAETPRSIEALVSRNIHNTSMHARLVWNNVNHHVRQGSLPFAKFVVRLCSELQSYVAVGAVFLLFLVCNRGIVVGDRDAHVATIHVPQMFYYSIFSMFFAWPYMLPHWRGFLRWTSKRWILASALFAIATVIVHSNTLVHPYLLADNRHYVFYVWNRFMGRYYLLRYILVPVYGFAIYAHLMCINHLRFLSQLIYLGSVCAVLIPQLLLEPRYFIIPYICLRLNMEKPEKWQLALELLTTTIVNCVQFYIFVTKAFYWTDGEYLQRISW